MTSAVALGQSLPLWALPLALLQNQTPERSPDGTAPSAKPTAGCAAVRSTSRVPLPATLRELAWPIPKPPASRPAAGSDATGLGFESLPTGLSPAEIRANPIGSAIPLTASASAAKLAIHPHCAQSGD